MNFLCFLLCDISPGHRLIKTIPLYFEMNGLYLAQLVVGEVLDIFHP